MEKCCCLLQQVIYIFILFLCKEFLKCNKLILGLDLVLVDQQKLTKGGHLGGVLDQSSVDLLPTFPVFQIEVTVPSYNIVLCECSYNICKSSYSGWCELKYRLPQSCIFNIHLSKELSVLLSYNASVGSLYEFYFPIA